MFAARIASCGCLMEDMPGTKVRITPCSTTCERMLTAGPDREGHRSFEVEVPESEDAE